MTPSRRPKAPAVETIEFRSSTKAFLLQSGAGWLTIASVPLTFFTSLIFVLPMIAIKAIENKNARYWLEGDRLLMRRGLLTQVEDEVKLYRITDIKATYSLIQKQFGNGDLTILSSDVTGVSVGKRHMLVIKNVPGAREIREELRARVEVARQMRGVREFDLS